MANLVYLIATSLDGYIAGPDGDVSAFPSSGDHIDALVEDLPETLPGPVLQSLGKRIVNPRFGAVIMGWNTYAMAHDHGLLDPYPQLRTVVCSRAKSGEGLPVTVSADPLEALGRLRDESERDIWLCGGAQLASALGDEIDRLVLKVNPITLGEGVPLFEPRAAPRGSWTLEASRHFASGVVMSEYLRQRS